MQPPSIAPLLEPFKLGSLTLPTRFVLPPMERGLAKQGKPLPALDDYYVERVKGGVSLIISEATAIDHPASAPSSQQVACKINATTRGAWTRCINAVHTAGGQIFIQLWHAGAFRADDAIRTVSPSGLVAPGFPSGKEASVAELVELRDAFVRSAVVAKQAGADGVELHGSNGYLLDQFLWAAINVRSDGYGGQSMSDRVRFPAEVTAAVREAIGPDMLLSYRFGQYKPFDFSARVVNSPEDLEILVTALRKAGADLFHMSALDLDHPEFPGSDLSLAGWTKSFTDAPVISGGKVGLTQEVWESFFVPDPPRSSGAEGLERTLSRFEAGEFDLLAVGRSLLADPQWIEKVREGRYDEIRTFVKEDIKGVDEHPFMMEEIIAAVRRAMAAA